MENCLSNPMNFHFSFAITNTESSGNRHLFTSTLPSPSACCCFRLLPASPSVPHSRPINSPKMGLSVSKALPPSFYDAHIDRSIQHYASLTGPVELEALPDELLLLICSYLRAVSLLSIGSTSHRLSKIAADEAVWRPRFLEKWGYCARRDMSITRFPWRQEYLHREVFVRRKGKAIEDESAKSTNSIWSRLSTGLGLWAEKKKKVVFVGLEAAGKVRVPHLQRAS
jgi:hypothetical protein